MLNRLFFVLFLLFASISSNANEFYDAVIDDIYYKLDVDTKEATVVMGCCEWEGPEGNRQLVAKASYSGNVIIPESFVFNGDTYYVTSIAGSDPSKLYAGMRQYGAFVLCNEMTSISIPKTVKRIGSGAFGDCSSLVAVYITDLSAWCNIDFELIDRFGNYYPDTNPLYYAHGLFFNGDRLSELVIPEDIIQIKDGSFIGGDFQSLIIHKDVSAIGSYSFDFCDKLSDVYIHGSSLSCEYSSFPNSDNITLYIREEYENNIHVHYNNDWNIEYISGIDYHLIYKVDNEVYIDVLYEVGESISEEEEPTKEGYTFSGWSEIPETMPDHDVTVSGNFTINNYKLTYIVDGINYKSYDVEYNSNLTSEPEPTRKGMVFSGWSEIPVTMPAKDVDVNGSFSWLKKTVDNVVYQVTDTTTNCSSAIGNDNVSGEVKILSSVDMDYSYKVTAIGEKAFFERKDITKVEIGENVAIIGERAFANIDKLTDVTCWAEEVPEADRTTFENSYIDYVILHVPTGSVEKYKKIAPWNGFKDIVAIEGTKAKFKLTYLVDNETYKTYELVEGAAITPEEEPTKEGYTFSGWSTIPETMPAKDVTITGTFSQDTTEKDVITIKDTGKGTWCSEYDLDFTNVEGIKAYTATGYDDITKTIWVTRVYTVPAGTGIMVKGDPGEYKIPHAKVRSYYANLFKGNTGSEITIYETDGEWTNYYMSKGQFVSVSGNAKIGKNRCYLQLPTSVFAGTRSIEIVYGDEETTGIIDNGQLIMDKASDGWYNLSGQHISQPTKKGLYIHNGRKVIIR